MASRSYVTIISRFPEASAHAKRQTRDAVKKALEEGEKAANIRIERINSSEAYNLPADVIQEGMSFNSGQIRYPHFYGQFFERGFYSVPAMPFMRPAARKMRTVFKSEMSHLFRGFRGVR